MRLTHERIGRDEEGGRTPTNARRDDGTSLKDSLKGRTLLEKIRDSGKALALGGALVLAGCGSVVANDDEDTHEIVDQQDVEGLDDAGIEGIDVPDIPEVQPDEISEDVDTSEADESDVFEEADGENADAEADGMADAEADIESDVLTDAVDGTEIEAGVCAAYEETADCSFTVGHVEIVGGYRVECTGRSADSFEFEVQCAGGTGPVRTATLGETAMQVVNMPEDGFSVTLRSRGLVGESLATLVTVSRM